MEKEIYKKKLYIKAKRRGTLELDLILGYIADNFLHTMDNAALKNFEDFINEEETSLLKWINKQEKYPSKYSKILSLITKS